MTKTFSLLSFLCLFAAMVFAGTTHASPAGKVSLLEGAVYVLKPGKNVVTVVAKADPVEVGDLYRTRADGKLEILFLNQNILRMAPNTRAEIKEYLLEGEKNVTTLSMDTGSIRAMAGEGFIQRVLGFFEGTKYEVSTPNAVIGIRGSDMVVSWDGEATEVLFLKGRGYAYNRKSPDKVESLTAGTVSRIVREEPPTPARKITEEEAATRVSPLTMKKIPSGEGQKKDDFTEKVTDFYGRFQTAYESRNPIAVLAMLTADWEAKDGTTRANLERNLLQTYRVFDSFECHISNLKAGKMRGGGYRVTYDLRITARIHAKKIIHEENGKVTEELTDDENGTLHIHRTLGAM
jgi:hypothetical protein